MDFKELLLVADKNHKLAAKQVRFVFIFYLKYRDLSRNVLSVDLICNHDEGDEKQKTQKKGGFSGAEILSVSVFSNPGKQYFYLVLLY